MSDQSSKGFLTGMGCVFAFIGMGLSATLTYGILKTIDAPQWMWVVFWGYVPALVVMQIIAQLLKRISED